MSLSFKFIHEFEKYGRFSRHQPLNWHVLSLKKGRKKTTDKLDCLESSTSLSDTIFSGNIAPESNLFKSFIEETVTLEDGLGPASSQSKERSLLEQPLPSQSCDSFGTFVAYSPPNRKPNRRGRRSRKPPIEKESTSPILHDCMSPNSDLRQMDFWSFEQSITIDDQVHFVFANNPSIVFTSDPSSFSPVHQLPEDALEPMKSHCPSGREALDNAIYPVLYSRIPTTLCDVI